MSTEAIRRKRAFLPKVKTGCKTCKSRKVKCDEAKPFCHRCTSSKRTCEGYTRNDDRRSKAVTVPATCLRTSPSAYRQRISAGIESWLESDSERRSFHFFLTHAGLRLGGYFQTPFWTREVMQAALCYPSILHLVVALGSAYEHFEGRQMDRSKMEFALQQSNQSIRHLTQGQGSGLTKQSVESSSTLVTASLLFTVLSSMQGHMADAMDHVRCGLRVLQDLEHEGSSSDDSSPTSGSSHRSPDPASSYPVPLSRLRSLLNSLHLQSRVMVSDASISEWHKDPLITDIDFPTCFASLTDAEENVESLLGNQVTFFQRTANQYPLTDDEIFTAQAHQDTLLYALECSRSALDAFVASRPLVHGLDDEASSIKVLRLYHLYLGIRLGVGVLQEDSRELAFDDFEPQFEQMLAYCKDLLDTGEEIQPTCCSGLGVVIPLYMIGHRCRHPIIRTEAVDLLLKIGRREGFWESGIAGRIAATTSSLEQDEELLKQWRVREVKTHFVDDKRARLVFITEGASEPRRYHREVDW